MAQYVLLPSGFYHRVDDDTGPYVQSTPGVFAIVATGAGGGGGGGAVTVADGADVTQGAVADAVIVAGAAGTVSSKLRAISRDIGTLAAAGGSNAAAGATGAAVPASAGYTGINVGGNLVGVSAANPMPGSVADGADVAIGAVADAAAAAGGTGTVSAKLRRISTQLPAALGSVAAASSLAATASTEDVARTGIITEAAPASDTASSGLNGRLQRIAQRLTSLIAQLPATLGIKTAANSLSVAPASDASFIATIADGADVAEGAVADAAAAAGGTGTVSAKLRRISTQLPAAVGATVAASSLPVTLATDGQFVTSTGSLTEAAPATDTASSGLNGRLQRIAQRLTSLIAFFTATAAADANRLPVDARDGLAVTGTVTSAATLFTQDLLGYESISVQITSAGTTCTITYECSEDQTTWVGSPGLLVASTSSATIASTSTTATILKFPRQARYFRARVSTYTSGTVTVVGSASKAPVNILTSAVVANASIPAVGLVAHGVAISGGPVRIGARALTANYAAVATGQQADTPCTLVGALIQKPYSIPEADWSFAPATGGITNTTVAVPIAAAAGAGIRNYLASVQLSAEALGAATEVAIRDGAGGTVLWRTKIGTAGLAAQSITFPNPLKSTANTLLEIVTLTASITGAVYANAQGYTAP